MFFFFEDRGSSCNLYPQGSIEGGLHIKGPTVSPAGLP